MLVCDHTVCISGLSKYPDEVVRCIFADGANNYSIRKRSVSHFDFPAETGDAEVPKIAVVKSKTRDEHGPQLVRTIRTQQH